MGTFESLELGVAIGFQSLKICGDSALVLGQASGPFQVKDVILKTWHAQITTLLRRKAEETSIT